MKKLISLLIIVLMATMVFASTRPWMEYFIQQQQLQEQKNLTTSKYVNGSMLVSSQSEKDAMELLLKNIQPKYKERLGTLDPIIYFMDKTGHLYAEGDRTMYLLGIWPQERRTQYMITEDGQVIRRFLGFDFIFFEKYYQEETK